MIWTVVGVWLMVRFLQKPTGDVGSSSGLRRRLERSRLLRGGWDTRMAASGSGSGDCSSAGSRPRWLARWAGTAATPTSRWGGPASWGLMVWGLFIVVPILDAMTTSGSASEHVVAISGAVAFSGVYVWLVLTWFEEKAYWRSLVWRG